MDKQSLALLIPIMALSIPVLGLMFAGFQRYAQAAPRGDAPAHGGTGGSSRGAGVAARRGGRPAARTERGARTARLRRASPRPPRGPRPPAVSPNRERSALTSPSRFTRRQAYARRNLRVRRRPDRRFAARRAWRAFTSPVTTTWSSRSPRRRSSSAARGPPAPTPTTPTRIFAGVYALYSGPRVHRPDGPAARPGVQSRAQAASRRCRRHEDP